MARARSASRKTSACAATTPASTVRPQQHGSTLHKPPNRSWHWCSALDHGTYWNPLTCAKVDVGDQVLLVSGAVAEPTAGTGSPGQVLEATPAGLVVTTASVPVRLTGLRDAIGQAVCPSTIARRGRHLALAECR